MWQPLHWLINFDIYLIILRYRFQLSDLQAQIWNKNKKNDYSLLTCTLLSENSNSQKVSIILISGTLFIQTA